MSGIKFHLCTNAVQSWHKEWVKSTHNASIWCTEVTPTSNDYAVRQGERLAELRKDRGLTQEQLAAKLQVLGCDLTRSAIAKVEVGQRRLYPEEIKALKDALHVTYDDLFI